MIRLDYILSVAMRKNLVVDNIRGRGRRTARPATLCGQSARRAETPTTPETEVPHLITRRRESPGVSSCGFLYTDALCLTLHAISAVMRECRPDECNGYGRTDMGDTGASLAFCSASVRRKARANRLIHKLWVIENFASLVFEGGEWRIGAWLFTGLLLLLILKVSGISAGRTGTGVAIRDGLYRVMGAAFRYAQIPWAERDHEDRGDGMFILAGAEVPKGLFAQSLPPALVRALQLHNAAHGELEQIRLRMALHAGEVNYDQHGVTAAAINLAFRLLDCGPAKEALADSPGVLAVITSSWFFEEVVRHCAAGPGGYHRVRVQVKETTTTGWICLPDHPHWPGPRQVAVLGGTDQQAVLRPRSPDRHAEAGTVRGRPAPVAAVHALPRDITSFTGRGFELDRLVSDRDSALRGGAATVAGVLTVDGMAGIGKTAFAVHAAHMLAPRFPDGQFFLPLHSHTPGQQPADPGAALGTLLLAAGIPASRIPGGVDARAMLWRSIMADKKVLLVLDDAGGHEQVRPLLPGSAASMVLVTSRRRLAALEEATPVSLGTLPPTDAAGLLARLAARPGSDADAAAIAEITRLCGYLPLAIRLIAGAMRAHQQADAEDHQHELDQRGEDDQQRDDQHHAVAGGERGAERRGADDAGPAAGSQVRGVHQVLAERVAELAGCLDGEGGDGGDDDQAGQAEQHGGGGFAAVPDRHPRGGDQDAGDRRHRDDPPGVGLDRGDRGAGRVELRGVDVHPERAQRLEQAVGGAGHRLGDLAEHAAGHRAGRAAHTGLGEAGDLPGAFPAWQLEVLGGPAHHAYGAVAADASHCRHFPTARTRLRWLPAGCPGPGCLRE